MDAARYAKIREVFFELEETAPVDRDALLEKRCGDDEALKTEVLALLVNHDPGAAANEGEQIVSRPDEAVAAAMSDSKLESSGSKSSSQDHSDNGNGLGEPTLTGPDRTHAAPQQKHSRGLIPISTRRKKTSNSSHAGSAPSHSGSRVASSRGSRSLSERWNRRTSRQFRITGTWLYLLWLVPTALIGYWTYKQIQQSLNQSIRNELSGVIDGTSKTADRFLDDKAELVRSWSRQEDLKKAISKLVEKSRLANDPSELRDRDLVQAISKQLQQLSGNEKVKFVVWNKSMTNIASWQPEMSDVGFSVPPSGAENLARVFRGETVLFGPQVLDNDTKGFTPETDKPVLALIVPVTDNNENIIAAMLVRGLGWYEEFSDLLTNAAAATQHDIYAANRDGIMMTPSPRAMMLASAGDLDVGPDRLAGWLRITDPDTTSFNPNIPLNRERLPVTWAVADLRGGNFTPRIEPYGNYAGVDVVGVSRWLPAWRIGIIVEEPVTSAFAPLRLVRNSYLGLAGLLALSSIAAAARIAYSASKQAEAANPMARYDVIRSLGTGGMGMVYQVRHRGLGRMAAMKILRADRQYRDDRWRFDREVRVASSLTNPHSVTIYDYGRTIDGDAYCVMEYLKGLTLHEVISRDGPQSIGRTLSILRQICDAMGEAHSKGLTHRDIKPHNIMLSLDPATGDWAVVFDYGLAKPLAPDGGVFETAETVWSGTPMYMAPERYRDPGVLDPRSDIYAIGGVAYFLLAGHPPFSQADPETLFALIMDEEPVSLAIHRGSPVPDEILSLIQEMMAKQVDDRIRSINELSDRIDEIRPRYPWTLEEAKRWWTIHGSDALEEPDPALDGGGPA